MKLLVDIGHRFANQRAHTATHLLHAQLAKIFPTTKQAGSLVDQDLLRFDFAADRLLTPVEISNIEKNINQIIFDSLTVETKETSYDEAIKLGAKAFFEEKYGNKVRVVIIQGPMTNDQGPISIELCGGTHVANTVEIGCFAIIGQEAVAAGIKRISAVTGPKVWERIQEVQSILDSTLDKLGIKTHTQLSDKLDKILKEYDEMKSKIESIEINYLNKFLTDFSKQLLIDENDSVINNLDFKKIIDRAKDHYANEDRILAKKDGSFAIYNGSGKKSAKIIAQEYGLKGGGSDSIFKGQDGTIIDILKKAEEISKKYPTLIVSSISSYDINREFMMYGSNS